MEKVQVKIGSVTVGSCGLSQDTTRTVEFVGEELAWRTQAGEHRSQITDIRGVTETLYKTDDGRLVIFVEDWSQWEDGPVTYSLSQVTEADLGVGGHFEVLGAKMNFERPLTLDEALERSNEPPVLP